MNCPHCDANLPDDAQSCPWCGAPLDQGAPSVPEMPPIEPVKAPPPPFGASASSPQPPFAQSASSSPAPAAPRSKGKPSILLIGGLALIALCCLVAVVGGGIILLSNGDSEDVAPSPGLPPVNSQPAQGDNPPGADLVPVQIVNLVEDTICYVAISPTSSEEWGDDLLGDDVYVDPGETVTVYVRPMAHADVGFFDCDQNVLGELYDVEVPPVTGMFTLEPGE